MAASKRAPRRKVRIDLRDAEGRLCARRTAATLGVRLSRVAGMLGRKPESLRMAPSGPGVQRPLARIERMIQMLRPIFVEEAGFRSSLRRRQTALGGKTVLDLLEQRKLQLVVDIAEDILFGNPA